MTPLLEIAKSESNTLEKYRIIKTKFTGLAKGSPRNTKESILSQRTLDLLEKRKQLLSETKSTGKYKKITKLSNQIRESIRKDRKNRRIETLKHHIENSGGSRKTLKELREKGKEWIPKLKKNKKIATKRKEIQGIATNYYQNLYSNPNTTTEKEVKEEKTY